MENAVEYLVKVNGLMVLFFMVYFIFLKKETFFEYNRWYLMIGFFASLVLPLVIFKQIVWIEKSKAYSNFDALSMQNLQLVSNKMAENNFVFDWNIFCIVSYFAVFSVLLMKFVMEYYSYLKILRHKKPTFRDGIKTIETQDNIGPFSFFKTIVINPNLYSELELQAIISHENVHAKQYHSVDVLISKIFTIVFWYNPLVWFYRKYMIQNLEYIADNKAVNNNINSKQYQYTLLKYTTNLSCVALTNPFYQSLIKKRIVMLNKKPSARANQIKLAIIIPLLAIFLWQFQTKIVAQEKVSTEIISMPTTKIKIEITKNTTDAFMKEQSEKLTKENNIDLIFSKVKRNRKGEITAIKVLLDDKKGSESEHESNDSDGIGEFLIVYDVEKGQVEIGFYTGEYNDYKKVPLGVTKTVINGHDEIVEVPLPPNAPPTPPTPPSFKALQGIFKNMPKPPTPPKNSNDKAFWDNYEKQMKVFEDKMADYEKNIEEKQQITDAEMEIYDKKMDAYDTMMKVFEEKMEVYQQEMKIYDDEMSFYDSTLNNKSEKSVDSERNEGQYSKRFKKRIDIQKRIVNDQTKAVKEKIILMDIIRQHKITTKKAESK